MWVKNTSATNPAANSGTVNITQQYGALHTVSISTGSNYTCTGIPNNRAISLPDSADYVSSDQYYMAKTALYRFLHFNDSIVTADHTFSDFYTNLSGSSIDAFMQVEEAVYNGSLTAASSLNSAVSPTNTVETNYQNYYSLYITFAGNDFDNTNSSDSISLVSLCSLCPGTNGACVYQARALYNAVFKQPFNMTGCGDGGARMANTIQAKNDKKTWDVSIFPNPATNQLNIVSSVENEDLSISITDLSGRNVLIKNLRTKGFIAKLDIDIINGAYFITINNSNNEKAIKKLIIAK
jgi:hypothetical protein